MLVWHRCPGRIELVSEAQKDKKGKDRDGCWISVGLQDIEFYKGGSLRCCHCGTNMAPRSDKIPPSHADEHAKFVLERLSDRTEVLEHSDDYDWATCYNQACSKRYLDGQARTSELQIGGKFKHGGTQYVMSRMGPDGYSIYCQHYTPGEEPAPKIRKRSWRRCIFCGCLMKQESGPSVPRMIKTVDQTQGWRYHGPAAIFRIWRWSEWNKRTGQAVDSEPLVVAELPGRDHDE